MILTISALSIASREKQLITPGPMTSGHHQIELRCDVCHGEDEESIQKACVECHGEELKKADDSHPVVKFKDPRNANRLEKIDATKCASCHREHQPDLTHTMGVSLPEDYCSFCHQEIATERPSHAGLGFETCSTAGCHNFHDNSSLYESFLASHLEEPDHKPGGNILKNMGFMETVESPSEALKNTDADIPQNLAVTRDLLNSWQASEHAASGINCSMCHEPEGKAKGSKPWRDTVSPDQCGSCHAFEHKSFLAGKHGMRIAEGLSPMTPSMARLPMQSNAAHLELNCTSCHGSHRFDTRMASVESCIQCHADDHSKAYLDSPHYTTWMNETRGITEPGTGVSCATCHMPRVEINQFGETTIEVDHNQNNTLRPNEKLIRTVCLNCHGLQFSLDSLADQKLLKNNFIGTPSQRIASLDMVVEEQRRVNQKKEVKQYP